MRKVAPRLLVKFEMNADPKLDWERPVTTDGDQPRTTTVRSPKGLIEIASTTGHSRLTPTSTPGEFRIEADSSARQDIDGYIVYLRGWASDMIKADGKEIVEYRRLAQSDVLDRATAAARLLVRLDRLQVLYRSLSARDQAIAGNVILETLYTATEVHYLTVVDNETPIAARSSQLDGASRGGAAKASKNERRNMKMAQEFDRRRQAGGRRSATSLMTEIGASEGLGRSAAIEAIKAGKKNLSGKQGKPDG
jgi:hypothetical protein